MELLLFSVSRFVSFNFDHVLTLVELTTIYIMYILQSSEVNVNIQQAAVWSQGFKK